MGNDYATWEDLERMGYTPAGVLKMIGNYIDLTANRRNIVKTNNAYMDEVRQLKRELEEHVKREAEDNHGV